MKRSSILNTNNKQKLIRVGLVGAGFAARGFALQCLRTPEIKLEMISNRTPDRAHSMLKELDALKEPISITDNAFDVAENKNIDVVVDATGDVEFGAAVTLRSIQFHKHVVLINAELDATLGPILKYMADQAGVIYSQADGDQPGAIMNLLHEVEFLGLTPVVAGNIKTFYNRHANPETQRKWASENGQSTSLATSAIDGTKLAVEMATVANAVGFRTDIRGMNGFKFDHVNNSIDRLINLPAIKNGGIIEYIIGAEPAFGVFVIVRSDNLMVQNYLRLYKMGNGPFYLFYRPFHLCTLEAHKSVINAATHKQATLAPRGLYCEVIAVAKKTLNPGDIIDGIGGFTTYGLVENSPIVQEKGFLPIGLSQGCVVLKTIPKDTPITFEAVTIPQKRLVDDLYKQQLRLFMS